MKKSIHPQTYREVVFRDISTGQSFLIKSSVQTNEQTEFEGKEYPLFKIETSSSSHPFYMGGVKKALATGQVDKFNRRFNRK